MSQDTQSPQYTDFHRTFAQYFLARNTVEKSDLETNFYPLLCQQYNCSDPLESTIDVVNGKINVFGLRIIVLRCNYKTFYCLLNQVNDPISKLASIYDEHHFDVIQEVVVKLRDSCDPVTENEMLGVLHEQLEMVNTKIDEVFEELKKDQWITIGSQNYVDLGARAYAELQEWLEEMEVSNCEFCKDPVLTGFHCLNDSCDCVVHQQCLQRLSRLHNPSCPRCKQSWNATEEEEESSGSLDLQSERRTTIPSNRRRRTAAPSTPEKRQKRSEENEEEDEDISSI